MKVSELIAALREADGDSPVILARDSEGNGFSPLADVDNDFVYQAESPGHGDAVHIDEANGEGVTVVVLWPTR